MKKNKAVVGKKLHCFVAMAFGREDTDSLYAEHISAASKEAGMIPVRVDRVVHNARIDAKIRELIEKADVVVADLTFARPSVYWEAGYGERKVPVVYTCRRDHLRSRGDDPNGNLQVHFDLRNANIITWANKGNASFRRDLKKRLLYVTRSIREDREKYEQRKLERENFSRLPLSSRQHAINDALAQALKAAGYKNLGSMLSGKDYSDSDFAYHGVAYRTVYDVFLKRAGSTVYIITGFPCIKSLLQRTIEVVERRLRFDFDAELFSVPEELPSKIKRFCEGKISAIRRVFVIPSLEKIQSSRVESVLTGWHRGEDLHYWRTNLRERFQRNNEPAIRAITSSTEVLLLSHIESASDLHEAISVAIRSLEANTTTVVHLSKRSSAKK